MIITLNYREIFNIAGSECVSETCPDGYVLRHCGTIPKDGLCAGHSASTPHPVCVCLDYNDRSFSAPDVKTMNACWEYCCKANDIYHAAKFGKYPRDC